jgi:hypothetical protein
MKKLIAPAIAAALAGLFVVATLAPTPTPASPAYHLSTGALSVLPAVTWTHTGNISTYTAGTGVVAAPTVNPLQGFALKDNCVVTACGAVGATINGGALVGYRFDPLNGIWVRDAAADVTAATGNRCIVLDQPESMIKGYRRDYSSTLAFAGASTLTFTANCRR